MIKAELYVNVGKALHEKVLHEKVLYQKDDGDLIKLLIVAIPLLENPTRSYLSFHKNTPRLSLFFHCPVSNAP